ncbi:MAG: hypothetical protein KA408_03335 [Flavobacteriales bacterium]|nr:hypothetical protein [Flavobacteriales bacterium]
MRERSDQWMHDYNHHRPLDALDDLAPMEFARQRLSRVRPAKALKPEQTLENLN